MTASSLPDVLAPAARSRFPHRARALLGLFAVSGASLEALKTGLIDWQRERGALEQQPPEQLRVGVRMAGTEEALQESVGSYFCEVITPLDAFITVDVDIDQPGVAELDALVARLGSVGDQLPGVVDRGRSFALVGLVNLVVAGDGPFAMMLVCTHHPDVALVDAHEWWCSFGEVVHGAVAQGHTLGYHQVQCDPDLSSRAAEAPASQPRRSTWATWCISAMWTSSSPPPVRRRVRRWIPGRLSTSATTSLPSATPSARSAPCSAADAKIAG